MTRWPSAEEQLLHQKMIREAMLRGDKELDRVCDFISRSFAPSSERRRDKLALASESAIDKAICEIYDKTDNADLKPHNIIEIVEPVQSLLRSRGLQASGRFIQKIANADKYKNRRRPPGLTLASERCRKQ